MGKSVEKTGLRLEGEREVLCTQEGQAINSK